VSGSGEFTGRLPASLSLLPPVKERFASLRVRFAYLRIQFATRRRVFLANFAVRTRAPPSINRRDRETDTPWRDIFAPLAAVWSLRVHLG
jgi:hypothetical protein